MLVSHSTSRGCGFRALITPKCASIIPPIAEVYRGGFYMSSSHALSQSRPSRSFLDRETEVFFRSMIDPAPYAVYGCLTFAAKVGDALADSYFRDLIHHVLSSSSLKDNIGWIRSTERTLSGCSDYGTRLHFHFIAFSHGFLSSELISRFWSDAMGDAR